MAEKKNEDTAIKGSSDPKIDAIKQLIFGENMAEYDQRFDEAIKELEIAKSDIETKRKELEDKMNSALIVMENEFKSKMEKMEDMFSKQVANLEDKKTNRKALGKMLQNIGEKLQA